MRFDALIWDHHHRHRSLIIQSVCLFLIFHFWRFCRLCPCSSSCPPLHLLRRKSAAFVFPSFFVWHVESVAHRRCLFRLLKMFCFEKIFLFYFQMVWTGSAGPLKRGREGLCLTFWWSVRVQINRIEWIYWYLSEWLLNDYKIHCLSIGIFENGENLGFDFCVEMHWRVRVKLE